MNQFFTKLLMMFGYGFGLTLVQHFASFELAVIIALAYIASEVVK